jgi:glycosyltransferase involved in cell wall biosynthesis
MPLKVAFIDSGFTSTFDIRDAMSDAVGAGRRGLRVRIAPSHFNPFLIELGQRNALFLKRGMGLPSKLPWRVARAAPRMVERMTTYSFTMVAERDFDLVHAINVIPLLTNRPYIVTFEDFMPRFPDDRYSRWLHTWLRRQLLDPRCIALVPMSEYARRQFQWQNRGFPELARLEKKIHVIYPAVPLRRSAPKKPSGTLSLLFVGRHFMRKGGPVALRVHERLRQRGVPVETTVVSALDWSPDEYVGPPSAEYVRGETARLGGNGVVHLTSAANPEVIELMQRADYMLAPTLHDTFGFASIEALSCGTPVIATNTCAQPEIVEPGRSGFLLPFDNEEHVGKWRWLYRNREAAYLDAYEGAVASLSDTLTDTLMSCWEGRSDYEALSAGALDRVRSRFHEPIARDQLERIYELCRTTT